MLATLVHFSALSVGQPELKDTLNSSPVTVKELPQEFPNYTSNYEKTVVTPCASGGGHLEGYTCVIPPPPPETMDSLGEGPGGSETGSTQAVDGGISGFIGSIGYSLPFGNCVDEPGVNNPGWGNPIDWPVLSSSPMIGSTVLFVFNHTAVVSGIYSNGDIEVYQRNSPGMPHRIPQSLIRGYR